MPRRRVQQCGGALPACARAREGGAGSACEPAPPLFSSLRWAASPFTAASLHVQVKKKDTAMPGYSLGYPMYHAMTGNLPVISKELHKSSEVGSEPAPLGEDLQPGWAELVDPISGSKFWWNTFYRSRREDRPTPMDDGRRGAGRGDVDPAAKAAARRARLQVRLATKTWQEKYDFTNSRPYYWNRKRNTVQWARPPSFHEDGLAYKPVWSEKVDLAGEPVYVNTKTGETTAAMPDDFDALPV